MNRDFNLFARSQGINSMALHDYQKITAGYINPTIIEERKLNVASMDVFSRLMMDRIIFLGTAIDDTVGNIITAQLLYMDNSAQGEDIQMYVNSPGGSVYSGYSVIDTMDMIKSDVSTIVTGMAASMGAVILANGTKGKRSALPHSRVMIHQPLGGAQGQASDIEITAREIGKIKKELYEMLSKNTGKTIEEIEKDGDRDFWMTSIEAKEYGIIDEVISR